MRIHAPARERRKRQPGCDVAQLSSRVSPTDPLPRPACPPQGKSAEKAAMAVQNKMNLQTAPIRTYLDSTVVPVLLQGLSALVKERCALRPPPFSRRASLPAVACLVAPGPGGAPSTRRVSRRAHAAYRAVPCPRAQAAQPRRVPGDLPAAEQPPEGLSSAGGGASQGPPGLGIRKIPSLYKHPTHELLHSSAASA